MRINPQTIDNLVNGAGHLFIFTTYSIGGSKLISDNLDSPYVQLLLPAIVVGWLGALHYTQEIYQQLVEQKPIF